MGGGREASGGERGGTAIRRLLVVLGEVRPPHARPAPPLMPRACQQRDGYGTGL